MHPFLDHPCPPGKKHRKAGLWDLQGRRVFNVAHGGIYWQVDENGVIKKVVIFK